MKYSNDNMRQSFDIDKCAILIGFLKMHYSIHLH